VNTYRNQQVNDRQLPAKSARREPKPAGGALIPSILYLRAGIGHDLKDEDLTRLLRQEITTEEAGFIFHSFRCGWVVFDVPPQNLENWFSDDGRVTQGKTVIARDVAKECGLALCEPCDSATAFGPQQTNGTKPRKPLELEYQWTPAVIMHPSHLKIRLIDARTKRPLPLPGDLLPQIAKLYRD
jgi:hypothetical protein